MERLIYLNGELVKTKEAKISVFDHGLLYGDGVFEGIRAYSGNIFKLKEHLDRLYNSAAAIMMEIPISKEEMSQAVVKTVNANKLRDAYIRLVVTRGIGDLGLNPEKCQKPTVFIIADKIKLYPEEYYKNGLNIVTAATRRNIPDALSPRIKSLNYLNNIMAKIEANRLKVPEALMLNREGYVAECTGDNIFLVTSGGTVLTPPLYIGALNGITRAVIVDMLSDMDVVLKETPFTLFEVYSAAECFLTGTAAEVIPVVDVDGRKISDGRPGELTLKLKERFQEITKKDGVKL
ncbi:MAG: branched-chain-amino-acid transaminase [Elusimicrobia bacterium]|jgi:branched-chain amino acid aminotransferase|nr:branched-chain-amino-acid transaminase [Elusimicrobiota bacterium]